MIDFKKKLGINSIPKKINPLEIYDGLDRSSEAGPLRPVQEAILEEWFARRRHERDLILKVHTGQGKTLAGLLILQSKLNENKSPCLYVCPNKYLAEQTCHEAKKFGIGYVVIGKDNTLPDQFLSADKILVTYVQKVFNGKSIFGTGGRSISVDTIVLDDSHACIEHINDSFKVKAKSDHELYKKLFALFEEDLREQGEGSLLEIQNGSSTILPVPYWSWQEKKSSTASILIKYAEDNSVKFTWDLIKDSLEHCQCLFSGKEFEISPYNSPIHLFGSFNRAKHRVLMSATTQNDSFFIKGLGLAAQAVKSPLVYQGEKWSGEKMILIPSLMYDELNRDFIISKITPSNENRSTGVVAITSSVKRAAVYTNYGCVITSSSNIFEEISKLRDGQFKDTVVIVNRYDGIDLPDNACRVLILDSLPYAEALTEQYEEDCRSSSEITNIRIAQKIEQGLGRSVRGEKDYSAIFLIGDDLIRFVKTSTTNKFFSEQTRKQIEIGREIAEMAKEESTKEDLDKYYNVLKDLVIQLVKRNDGWKQFYKKSMDSATQAVTDNTGIIEVLELERKAEDAFFKGDPEAAMKHIQNILDNHCAGDLMERGWYLQTLARYQYKISKTESNKIQMNAFRCNYQLLKPKEGINYQKVSYINESRIKRIKSWIEQSSTHEDLMLKVNEVLDNLSFGQPAEKFERALQELGKALGFISQRPDKEFKKGPDNLWCVATGEYFIFECKSDVEDNRTEIYKSETGQMNNHCGWFDDEYKTDKVKRIVIIPTKTVSREGNFTHDVQIMRKGKLQTLKKTIRSFFLEFKDYDLTNISDSKIQGWLEHHKLDVNSMKIEYTEDYYQKK